MEYRKLGTSGLQVSLAGIGCNNFGMTIDADQTRQVVSAALDAGVTLFDTADCYAGGTSETAVGNFLARTKMRDKAWITSKSDEHDPAALERTLATSLTKLQTDHVDL